MAKSQHCPSCGSSVLSPGNFCGNCGAFLSSEGTSTTRINSIPPTIKVKAPPTVPIIQPRQSPWRTIIKIFFSILLSCGAIVALRWASQVENSQTELPVEPQTILPAPPPSAPTQTQLTQASMVVSLEDTEWQGSYHRSNGPSVYGGRTATWIYGTSTQYNKMWTTFNITSKPTGTVILSIEGMDAEGISKTDISITVNGVEIYNGPNPLPDDDYRLETGTWETREWQFDAALLRLGQNEITISNLSQGNFSVPPWFMLDYAEIAYTPEGK